MGVLVPGYEVLASSNADDELPDCAFDLPESDGDAWPVFVVISAAKREYGPFWIICDASSPVEITPVPFAPKEFWKFEETVDAEWANKRPFATSMGGGRVAKCAPPLSWYRNPQFRVNRAGQKEKEEAGKHAAEAAANLLALEYEADKPSSAEGGGRNLVSAGSGKQESAGSGSNKSRRRSSMAAPPPQKLPTVEVAKKRDSSMEVETLLEIFTEVDKNNNGSVSRAELIKACRRAPGVAEFFGLPSYIRQEDGSRDMLEELFQDMDVDNDKDVTWDEFVNFYTTCKENQSDDEEDEDIGPSGALLVAILLPEDPGQAAAAVHIVVNNEDAPDTNGDNENCISENPGYHTVIASSGKPGAEYSDAAEIGAVCELTEDVEEEILIIPSLKTRDMVGKYRLVIKSTEAITVDRVA